VAVANAGHAYDSADTQQTIGDRFMDEVVALLRQLLEKVSEVASTLEEMSHKLDNVNGVYGLDDVVERLDAATQEVTGALGYSITDLHQQLTFMTTELVGINSKAEK
jgi:methyl-accepting chemotaxis protein